MTLVVRALICDDALRYRQLMLDAYDAAPDAFTSTAAERSAQPLAWWQHRVGADGDVATFGAVAGEALQGAVTLTFNRRSKTAHKAHLVGMFVREAARGQGAGAALLAAALDAARARPGVVAITLTVTAGNLPALRLYENAGFRVFGTEPLAIRTPSGFAAKVHMVWGA